MQMATTEAAGRAGRVRVEQGAKRVRAYLGGELVADTIRPRLVWEVPYYPAYYVPLADVRTDLLVATATVTHSLSRGDPQDALAHFQLALQEHKRVTRPFELARTLRAQGMVLRRDKHKTAAKAALEQALGIFELLGALLWAESTKAELDPVGLRRAAPVDASGITAAEAKVAAGRTNREVASELFMSPKTVEAHLTRIYRLVYEGRTLVTRVLSRDASGWPPAALWGRW
jgi:DNA-binding CsgD family transcriptional regulator